MKTYIKKEDGGILMHSDTYLGEDYISSNLMHYKYLRKEIRNGHTYYIYDDSEMRKAQKEKNKAIDVYKNTEYVDKNRWSNKGSHRWMLNGGKDQTLKDKINEKRVKKATKTIASYYKQRIKDIPRKIHARGVSFISNLIRLIRGD